jgi:hypothetical protein
MRPQFFDQRQKHCIKKQPGVLGVIEDVRELVWKQTRIHRMEHCSDARNRVIQLQMPMAVPRQRRDSIARFYPV